ncbi:MAG: hypothetical protein K0R36_1560 [Chryseobacterium sp.]|jgi:hypothetical protein|nr:hypothetical protein [Chryseobacterium sp.]
MKNFSILQHKGIISDQFLSQKITDFSSACKYISELPYKRNLNKSNIKCVFDELAGTCSTKHAVLRKLALENNHPEVKLILGIFKMNTDYTFKIKKTLGKYHLNYIPEAHNYLKIKNEYFDFTKPDSDYRQFRNKILIKKEIEYDQIFAEKILFHKDFLKQWIVEEKIPYNLEEIWNIREQCIEDLQKNDEVEIQNSSSVCFAKSQELRDDYKL